MEQEVCVKGGAAWILLSLLTLSFTKIEKRSIKFLSYSSISTFASPGEDFSGWERLPWSIKRKFFKR